MMEVHSRSGSTRANEKQPLGCSTSVDEVTKPAEGDANPPPFVNHAVIAWHETRRCWVGDQSQKTRKMAKDPIISWTTTYEELLSSKDPFSEPIPLSEMVDFLADIWHDEGLFD